MSSGTINLIATYEYLEKHGDIKGTLWSEKTIKHAANLQDKVLKLNELLRMKHHSLGISSQSAMTDLENELDDFVPGKTYEVPTVFGKFKSLEIPKYDSERPRITLVVHGIVEISKSFTANGEPDEESPYARLYELKTRPLTKHEKNGECTHKRPPWQLWEGSWDTGAWDLDGEYWGKKFQDGSVTWGFWKVDQMSATDKEDMPRLASIWSTMSQQLTSLVQNNKPYLKNVDKVICFGLGPLNVEQARSFIQHKAAATVAKALTDMRGSPVRILAQDPAYCSTCIEVLKTRLGIEATPSYDAFFEVDRNTVIITFAPTGPICPIIADLTREFAGPAAMLCDKIESDFMKPHERKEENWIDNEPTWNLVEYMRMCSEEYFGDKRDLFSSLEMTYENFISKYPRPPIPANIAQRTSEQNPETWKKGYRLDAQSCFPDSGFYVLNAPG